MSFAIPRASSAATLVPVVITVDEVGEGVQTAEATFESDSQPMAALTEILSTEIPIGTVTAVLNPSRPSDRRLSTSTESVGLSATKPATKTAPAVIAGIVIGSLVSVLIFVLLFVLWRRKISHNTFGKDTGDANVPDTTSVSDPILTPVLVISSTHRRSIESIISESSTVTRRLSQSSRTAYEEEITRLRRQITYMEEEMELMYSGSPPPSYRSSRRSNVSDPFLRSSSPLPPLPSRDIDH